MPSGRESRGAIDTHFETVSYILCGKRQSINGKEFDTYKVGTTANSTSTMHKLTSKPITIDCFETDDYCKDVPVLNNFTIKEYIEGSQGLISMLESLRIEYLRLLEAAKNSKSKEEINQLTLDAKLVWKELIRWLPESWLQTRTVTMNYENILSMVHQRKNHKLTEWSGNDQSFIEFAKSLPYSDDFIF